MGVSSIKDGCSVFGLGLLLLNVGLKKFLLASNLSFKPSVSLLLSIFGSSHNILKCLLECESDSKGKI